MIIIVGGTGHIGSTAAQTLLDAGEAVTIVTRDADKAEQWRTRGAETAVLDVMDTDHLRDVFRTGTRALLINPPAAPSTDTDLTELATGASIVDAVHASGLQFVVGQSTYGAQPCSGCGDLGTLHAFEQGLLRTGIPVAINRGAYYFSNWDSALDSARDEGTVSSMFPADFRLAMVAPDDLGRAAARLLTEPTAETGIRHVEGPRRCSAADVAAAFASSLGRDVTVSVVDPGRWTATYEKLGFSPAAAESYTNMNAITLAQEGEQPTDPERGTTTLEAYIQELTGVQELAGRGSPVDPRLDTDNT